MKVLYIGNYRDGTGWGNAALSNILALNAAGVEVVPRAITYEHSDRVHNKTIQDLERQNNIECDIVVQHALPHNYSYSNSYKKNIGYLAVESSDFKTTGWQYHCNLMDEIWACSEAVKRSALNSGVTKPIKVVPHSLDLDSYKDVNGEKIKELNNMFTFGFVGEFIERKNIKALIQAFHMEFDPREPVNLFIKTSKRDLNSVQKYAEHIKKGLKLRKNYREEIIIAGMMPTQDYLSILSQIDCFVMPSRGEGFCIPSLEAMALGVPSIWTKGIGMDHAIGQTVDSYDVPCFGAVECLDGLDTAASTWKEIDILKLCEAMRDMYNQLSDPSTKEQYRERCFSQSLKYSHKNIGMKMKEFLNDC